MPEEFEEQNPQQFDMRRYVGVIRRRHILFLTLLFVGWGTVWSSSWFLPARYKSATLILVQEPSMPKNYVEPNVSDSLQDRLDSITQQILSRTRLLMIIDKLHLYQNGRQRLTPDGQVERMRKDIDIELVRDSQNQAITSFRILYSGPDPHVAQEVTSELTNLFIDENLKVREQESESTTAFIQNQLASARASLADQETRVHTFQAAHEGELPTQEASNLQILSGLQSQLQNEQDALNTAMQQSAYHESLMEQYRAMPGAPRTAKDAPASDDLQAIDQQLDKLRTKLQDLSTRYTDQYPEVQQVKSEIASAEKTKEQLIANQKKKAPGKEQTGSAANEEVSQSPAMLQIQGQERADQLEISNRKQAISSLKSRINDYQARLSGEPAVEQQLADLTRGYEQSQTNYNDLLKKESDSQMATSMEQMQEGERFTMLDPPSLPLKPDSPNRLKMCEAGLGVGLGLGVLVVVLLEFLDDRMHSEREIEKLLGMAVISDIPEVLNSSDVRRRKWRSALGWVMASLVFGVILVGSALSYLHS
jgi:succinoglycan biosynthesis transport protein ExoP